MSKNVPDSFEPIIGWRAWGGVQPDWTLSPLASGLVDDKPAWPHKVPAQCMCTSCGAFAKPTMRNGSGMYAFRSVIDLYKETPNALIIGQIYMWGTIVVCGVGDGKVKGYRSEFAYPKHLLCVDASLVEELAKRYGVPCEQGLISDIMEEIASQRGIEKHEMRQIKGGHW